MYVDPRKAVDMEERRLKGRRACAIRSRVEEGRLARLCRSRWIWLSSLERLWSSSAKWCDIGVSGLNADMGESAGPTTLMSLAAEKAAIMEAVSENIVGDGIPSGLMSATSSQLTRSDAA